MDIQSAEKLNHWKKMLRTNIILKIKKAMFQSFQNELIFLKILVFIQLIIPPFFYENRFIVNFKQKTEFFNSRFSKQCVWFWTTTVNFHHNVHENDSSACITFEINDIEKITKKFDPNKSYGHIILRVCIFFSNLV